jgi:hypothetical protein
MSLGVFSGMALPFEADSTCSGPSTGFVLTRSNLDGSEKVHDKRDIPKVGDFDAAQLAGAAAKSNEALCQIGAANQWVESYVADDKTFCVYLATDEPAIRRHSELSGLPANKITEIRGTIDPSTAKQ